MARIPVYHSQTTPGSGTVRFTSGGQGPDLGGLQRGLHQASAGIDQQRENAERLMEHERQREEIEFKAADRIKAGAEEARLVDHVADTAMEVRLEVLDGKIAGDKASTEYRARVQKVLDPALEQVPQAHREQVRTKLFTTVERQDRVQVSPAVQARRMSDNEAGLTQSLEYLSRKYASDAAGATQAAFETIDQLGPFAGWNPARIAKTKQAFVEAGELASWTQQIGLNRADNKKLAILERELQGNDKLDPQRKASMLVQIADHQARNDQRALVLAQRAELAAQRHERKATSAWNVINDLVAAGKMPDEATVKRYAGDLRGTAYEKALPELLKQVPARAAAAMLPMPVQKDQLNALYAHRNLNGTNPELEKEIKRREDVLRSSETDYGKDPLYAAAERGVIPAVASIDGSSIDTLIGTITNRVQQASTVAPMAGRPVSPLLAEEARQLGDALAALNPPQRSEKIAALASRMPADQARALAQQIGDKDRALMLQFAAGMSQTTQGRFTSELIARGAQAVKDKAVKEDNAAMVGVKAQASEVVGEALTGKTREDVIDAARYIYLAQQAEGSGADIRRAVRLAIGGDIIEHNGKRIPVPAGVTDMGAKVRAIPAQAVASQTPDGKVYLPGSGPMAVADFMARLPDAVLEPVGMGRYAVRSGGRLAVNAAGKPITIEVR
jgi:hypothetical protein